MRLVTVPLTLLALAVPAATAGAVVPGGNGRIAFGADRTGKSQVYTADPDGTDLLRLTGSRNPSHSPAWSPDGRRIAFVRAQQLWVMRFDGTRERRITRRLGDVRDPVWSPDGRRILFATETRGADLWTIRPSGRLPRRLASTPGADEFEPDWAPDGRHIAFVRGKDEAYRIYLARPDGRGARRLLPRRMKHHFHPAWSPDGRRIAFHDGNDRLFVARADGSGRERLGWGNGAVWSPDGRRLAYSEQDEWGTEGILYTRRAGAGGNGDVEQVSPWGRRYVAADPSWQAVKAGR